MTSIRSALTARLLTGAFVMLAIAGVILAAASHSRLIREFDRALETKARALATLSAREGRKIEVDFDADYMPEFKSEVDPEYFQVLLQDGSLIRKSDSMSTHGLPVKRPLSQTPIFFDLRLPDGRRGRLVQIAVTPRADAANEEAGTEEKDQDAFFEIPPTLDPASASIILSVARSREDFDALSTSLYLMLAGIHALLLLGIGILVRLTVGSGLAPIDAINKQICAIEPQSFDRRIRLPIAPQELQTILSALNGLLERLQNSFERERRFSSNVAHELRTPVAELRSACEVGGKWPEDTENTRRFFSDIREIALQMEKTVTNLLMLARCDNGTATVSKERVLVGPLIRQCWDRSPGKANTKQLRLELQIAPGIAVSTDQEKFEIVIRNLLENAIAYGVPGSAVTCTADNTDSGIELAIENQAAGFVKEDLAHMFERFWRKHSAGGDSHSGLGLSIVKALCELLGIGLRVDLKEESLFVVRLALSKTD